MSKKIKIDAKDFLVLPGERINLGARPTLTKEFYGSKKKYHALLEKGTEELSDLQRLHYASNGYAVLLIFQGMDTSGKDSTIRQVMSGVNPQGCQVHSFKQPSAEELQHDFLWRAVKRLPERGKIGIFNRSYYEEVLIVRVHPEKLRSQGIPAELLDSQAVWEKRYRSIIDLENHLDRNGTRIIKMYLHESKNEQRRRLIRRIDNPSKNWKLSDADIKERELWSRYIQAYEECISATSTQTAPWYIVPADDKKNARLIVLSIILNLFNDLNMNYPMTDEKRRQELVLIRKSLSQENPD